MPWPQAKYITPIFLAALVAAAKLPAPESWLAPSIVNKVRRLTLVASANRAPIWLLTVPGLSMLWNWTLQLMD
jgi:hypothetical protein